MNVTRREEEKFSDFEKRMFKSIKFSYLNFQSLFHFESRAEKFPLFTSLFRAAVLGENWILKIHDFSTLNLLFSIWTCELEQQWRASMCFDQRGSWWEPTEIPTSTLPPSFFVELLMTFHLIIFPSTDTHRHDKLVRIDESGAGGEEHEKSFNVSNSLHLLSYYWIEVLSFSKPTTNSVDSRCFWQQNWKRKVS